MIVSAHRFRSIGWIALLLICGALVMVLAFRVNALRSQVHRTEQRIIALRKEKLYLETEVETRANQQQLKLWNDVEFGYVAPTAGQYLASERQLAALAKPDGPGSPTPIRVASADDAVAAEAAFPSVIAGLASAADFAAPAPRVADDTDSTAAAKPADAADRAKATANLGARLAMVTPLGKDSKTGPGKGKGEKAGKDNKAGDNKAGDGDGKPALARSAKAATPAKSGKGDAEKPGKGAKLAPARPDAKPGKASPAKSGAAHAENSAKAAKPAAKGSKSAP